MKLLILMDRHTVKLSSRYIVGGVLSYNRCLYLCILKNDLPAILGKHKSFGLYVFFRISEKTKMIAH
jgi:hypothetical protein